MRSENVGGVARLAYAVFGLCTCARFRSRDFGRRSHVRGRARVAAGRALPHVRSPFQGQTLRVPPDHAFIL